MDKVGIFKVGVHGARQATPSLLTNIDFYLWFPLSLVALPALGKRVSLSGYL